MRDVMYASQNYPVARRPISAQRGPIEDRPGTTAHSARRQSAPLSGRRAPLKHLTTAATGDGEEARVAHHPAPALAALHVDRHPARPTTS
jgi:hypothetical protein